jgi:NitT/TauT family transport system substrate-binding protein
MNTTKYLGAACAILAASTFLANATFAQNVPLSPQDRAPLTETVPIKIGILASTSLGAVFVAKQFGYFSDEKLDAQTELLVNTQDALVLLAQGRLDAIAGSISAGMLNAIASGLNVRIASALSTTAAVPGVDAPSPGGLFVRKDLFDSGQIKTYADMKGRNIGSVGGMGTSVSFLIGLYAQRGGLTLKDVSLQPFSNADMLTALKTNRVDIAFLTAPFSQQAIDQNLAVEFGNARDVYGKVTQSAIVFGPNFLEKNKRAGVAFMRALDKANNEMKGDYRKDDRIMRAIAAEMKAPLESIKSSPPYTMSLDFNPETVLSMQQMFFDIGKVLSYTQPLTADQIINHTWLDAARGK